MNLIMKKQFAIYEIALGVKELGFDEPCLCFYNKEKDEYKLAIHAQFDSYNFNMHKNSDMLKSSRGGLLDVICAPLWQQVIDWFRDKYNLCIEIQCPQREFDFYSWTIHEPLGINDEEYNCQTYEDGFTNNYYKAREQAILKAIELCKEKK